MAVNINGRLTALDLRIQTNVLENRKSAHLRLDQRREALKIVKITGLERVLVKTTPVHQDIEKETAEVISASEEKQQHSGEHETLHLKREIGDQPTEDGDGDNRTERANNEKGQQAAEVTRGWPTTGETHSPPGAPPQNAMKAQINSATT